MEPVSPKARRYFSWTGERRPLRVLSCLIFMMRMWSNFVVIMKVLGRYGGLLFQPGSVV
jgi:hypothetical protein